MIACLPMYARPELDDASRNFWHLIRDNLRSSGMKAPDELNLKGNLMTVWTNPELVLSQTCGMPYRMFLHGKVNLIGAPDYGLENCPTGFYRSVIIAHRKDHRKKISEFSESRFAYNEEYSHSGFAAPLNHATELGFTLKIRIKSGSHANSAQMVANGQAEVAALDVVSWELIKRYDSFASQLKVVGWTAPPTPSLPFVTSVNNDPETVFSAIANAIQNLSPTDRDTLILRGIVKISPAQYLTVPNPTQENTTPAR